MKSISVLVVDDHPEQIRALVDTIESEESLVLAGSAQNAAEAVVFVRERRPEVVLMDVRMPGGGAWATSRIREVAPETRVIALSAHGDREDVIEMIRAGAVGYLLKGASASRLVGSIHRAAEGEAILSRQVAMHVIRDLAGLAERAEKMTAQLLTTDRLKAEILQSLSSQLLAPATAIRGGVQMLLGGEGIPKGREIELVSSVEKATARIERLVKDINTTAVLRGDCLVDAGAVAVRELLSAALAEIPVPERRLRRPPDDELGLTLRAEPELAGRALVALLANALAMSPDEEPIEIQAEPTGSRIEIRVSDRGPGVPPEMRDHIFNVFTQADASTTWQDQDFGTGLYLARRIMEVHNGTIDVLPRPGGGSIFNLSFPAANEPT